MVKKSNRIIAFILAGLMLAGAVGTLFSVLAHAYVIAEPTYDIVAVYRGGNFDVMFNSQTPGNPYIGSSGTDKTYYADITIKGFGTTLPDGVADFTSKTSELEMNVGGSFLATSGTTKTIINVRPYENGIKYDIVLTKLEYSGKGRYLSVGVKSKSTAGFDYDEVASVMIDECVPKNSNSDDDDYSGLAVATPYVIVSKYTYGGNQIVAGDTFNLTMTFYNTSIAIDVSNMMVTVTMPEDLMLTSSSNTFYIDWLDRDTTVTKTVQVKAKPAAKPQSHNIDVSMQYQYIDHRQEARKDSTTKETIAIPVVQIDRFQATGIDMDAELVVGQESYLAVNYVNKGRSEVYNVSVSITGNIQNPGQNQNMGNLASGATGSADFYIIPSEEGTCSGEVVITYEDTNSVEKTVTVPFSGEAIDYNNMGGGKGMDPGMMDPGMMDPGVIESEAKPIWPFIVGAVVVIGIPAVIIIRKKIAKKRSDALDADL